MVSLSDISLKEWQDKNLEYLRYEYENVKHCIDIGSYRNEWADGMKRKFNCSVECFEALDNRAAWIYDGEIKVGEAFYYTTMYADQLNYSYKCFDIARYINEVDVMKINIEGGEYDLLNYIIDKGLIGRIKNIQVQFHLVSFLNCEKLYNEISDKLNKTHHLTWSYPFCWENWKINDKL